MIRIQAGRPRVALSTAFHFRFPRSDGRVGMGGGGGSKGWVLEP